jgi:hydrogenase nickel incorporation protein HypA/HybF
MHELPVIEQITRIAVSHAETHLAKKVVRIRIRVGELSDLYEEWMQRYFDFVSKGTLAEGAALEIEWTPVMFRCDECAKVFPVKIREGKDIACPGCASGKTTFLSGREYFVREIEVI